MVGTPPIAALRVSAGVRQWTLAPGQSARVGRGSEVQISVDHPLVSRSHAYIYYDEGWWIQDEHSSHGLWVGDSRVSKWRVETAGKVGLGHPSLGAAALELKLMTPVGGTGTPSVAPVNVPLMGGPVGGLRVGRGRENDLQLNDVLASRHHAILGGSSEDVLLTDLGSLNGTFVNGRRIAGTVPVRPGDRVVIGNSDFRISVSSGKPELEPYRTGSGLSLDAVGFEVRDGRKTKALLRDIDFSARHGQLLAVIGPSGAGKSTLMSVMTGANRPTSGTVLFDDQDVSTNFSALRSRIGFVPQEDIVHRNLTVQQALHYAARLRLPADTTPEERSVRCQEVLDKLGLAEHADTRVDKLSGGQRKRASVALELLTEPSLLILDEPTSGLDPSMDKQVMETLRLLADGGRVVIVVTHNVANLSVCDQVLVLAKGGLPAYVGRSDAVMPHFGVADWAGVFSKVYDEAEPVYERFRSETPQRIPSRDVPLSSVEDDSAQHVEAPRQPWFSQMRAVAGRQWRLLLADSGYLTFLALLPIVLGVLALVVPGNKGFGVPTLEEIGEPSQLLVVLIFGSSFMGMALSVRDLIGERAIYRREKAVGLRAGAYLSAKTLVFTVICLVQSLVMTLIVLWGKPAPIHHLVLDIPGAEIFIAIAATAITCSVLGLLISAGVRSADQVMPLLVVGAMAQLVLSGGLIPVTGRIVLEQLSWLAPTRWGFSAGASSIDLKDLVPSTEDDWLWDHSLLRYGLALCSLLLIALVCWCLTFWRLARQK